MQRTRASRVDGAGCPSCCSAARDPRRHVAGRQERRIVRIDGRTPDWKRCRAGEQAVEVRRFARLGPRAHGFLQEPQPHHVAQEAHPAVHATFVREVRRPAGVRDDRPVELDTHEAPRSARDVGEGIAARRNADDRRGRVVRADVDHRRRRGEAGRFGDVVAERPEPVAGVGQVGEQPSREPERVDDVPGPGRRCRVEQAGRGGVRALRRRPAGQPGADEIGDEDHRGCIRERGFGLGRELVERVEGQELQARPRVETVRRHDRVDALDAAGGSLVTVVERLGDELTAGIEQPVIDAPCVDADAGQVVGSGRGMAQSLEDLAPDGGGIPAQPLGRRDGPFGKR